MDQPMMDPGCPWFSVRPAPMLAPNLADGLHMFGALGGGDSALDLRLLAQDRVFDDVRALGIDSQQRVKFLLAEAHV